MGREIANPPTPLMSEELQFMRKLSFYLRRNHAGRGSMGRNKKVSMVAE